MKRQDARERELLMWRMFWVMSIAGIVGIVMVFAFRRELVSLPLTIQLLAYLFGLWFIGLPLVYPIDIHPRKRRERQPGESKPQST